ncbi:MAG: hypothetical protein EBV42_03975 [Actinobacteria bacterium]|nr:hypothetical protein [Actinomycetota bacterium]
MSSLRRVGQTRRDTCGIPPHSVDRPWRLLLALPAPGHLLPGGASQGLNDNLGHDHDGFFYALLEKRLA